jgi:hypothetical protein
MSKLTPPDPRRCQAEISGPHGFMTLGPRPRPERCKEPALVIARETKPGPDGLHGEMSLCSACYAEFLKRMPGGTATFTDVTTVRTRIEFIQPFCRCMPASLLLKQTKNGWTLRCTRCSRACTTVEVEVVDATKG